ncbi:MAG: hypothetical protein M3R52_11920, partial [Acidobacteriota bacterium]|nr:hypothetical protein [Acidobacteriota bacterium]
REHDAGGGEFLQDQSRLTALAAGETPALPVKSLSDLDHSESLFSAACNYLSTLLDPSTMKLRQYLTKASSLRKARDVIMARTSPIRLAGNRREAGASPYINKPETLKSRKYEIIRSPETEVDITFEL